MAINFRSRENDALETARLVEAAGASAMIVQADVADQKSVETMVARVNEQMGPIDMLVNNAGIFEYVTPETTTLDHWKRTIDVNLTGLYIVTWAVKDQMAERRFGRIVNMSSISGLRSRPYGIAYSASKAGVIAFTKSASEALIPLNIRMNAVAPGLVETDIIDDVDQPTIDRIVLRMSVFELRHRRETEPAVVLNEAVELAKKFSTEDSGRYVNGVLARLLETEGVGR